MSHASFYIIIRVAIVVIVLLAMIIILMGINHYSATDRRDTEEEARKLKREVENSRLVISSHSVFHKFLPRPLGRRPRHQVNDFEIETKEQPRKRPLLP